MNRNQSINQSIIIIYNASLKETLRCECECKFIQCIIVQKPTMQSTVLVISKQLDFNLEQKKLKGWGKYLLNCQVMSSKQMGQRS